MGKFIDFCIRFDPNKDTANDLVERILYSLVIRRLKGKKPVVMFIGGDSGEGKSQAALRLQEILLKIQGLDLDEHLEDVNVFLPTEYPTKLDNLLFNKQLKKLNMITIHEARTVVKAKMWHSFLNQAVSDVNAMSRSIKRIFFIIISQFIRDIDTDIRYTLNYYVTASRPIEGKTRLYINRLWKDDSDLERPKLKKRRLRGWLVYPNGRYRLYEPKYLEINLPSRDIVKRFEKLDFESKAKAIRRKTEKLIQQMNIGLEQDLAKVKITVDWYMKHPETLNMIGKKYRGNWRIKPEVRTMHGFSDQESKDFQELLNKEMKKKGMV